MSLQLREYQRYRESQWRPLLLINRARYRSRPQCWGPHYRTQSTSIPQDLLWSNPNKQHLKPLTNPAHKTQHKTTSRTRTFPTKHYCAKKSPSTTHPQVTEQDWINRDNLHGNLLHQCPPLVPVMPPLHPTWTRTLARTPKSIF